VKIAVASHPHTPRHVSVPLARQFYTFDLMKVALAPGVPADVKVAIDGVLIARLKTVTLGERMTLARRASAESQLRFCWRLTAAMENREDQDDSIEDDSVEDRTARATRHADRARQPASHRSAGNPIVLRAGASAALVHAVARHEKWSRRKEIRAALLRTEHLSLARALEFGREIPAGLLQELLASSRLPRRSKINCCARTLLQSDL